MTLGGMQQSGEKYITFVKKLKSVLKIESKNKGTPGREREREYIHLSNEAI